MQIKSLYYSSGFEKSLRKFTPKQKELIQKKIEVFVKNPFASQLKTHKLKGKLNNYWSFSINYSLRILFEFISKESVGFIDIGTHSIYKI